MSDAISKAIEAIEMLGEWTVKNCTGWDNEAYRAAAQARDELKALQRAGHPAAPTVTKNQISEAIFGWGLRNEDGNHLTMDDTDEIAEYIMAQAMQGEAVAECSGCNVVTTRPDGGEIKWCCYCGRPTEDYNNE